MTWDWSSRPHGDGIEGWHSSYPRYTINVWPFGGRFQCKVMINVVAEAHSHNLDDLVGLGAPISRTLEEAQERGIEWVERYEAMGRRCPTPEEIYGQVLRCPQVFPNLRTAMRHVWTVVGNGLIWLDGGLHPAETDYEEEIELPEALCKLDKTVQDLMKRFSPKLIEEWEQKEHRAKRQQEAAPCWLLSSYSRLSCLPDNITPQWLIEAKRAVELVRNDWTPEAVAEREALTMKMTYTFEQQEEKLREVEIRIAELENR